MVPADVTRVRDTCNVWAIRTAAGAVCVDFGSGAVLDRLDELGIERITDVLVTHHHRDGVQGLQRAVDHGARIWAPPMERELLERAGELWPHRRPENDYVLRQERFSPLASVELAGTVDEYRWRDYGGLEVYALPTPGHTMGSVTYLVRLDGRLLAFSGDLIHSPGKVWSLAATQWTYTGVEGQASTVLSCLVLARRGADLLLPAHGDAVERPAEALGETAARLRRLLELRRGASEPWNFEAWLDEPWQELSPHLLRNRTSEATAYALLSESGAALLFDWGYDQWTGWPYGGERAATRPLLTSIEALKRRGVERIETVVTTHYHDDHVAGLNLLRNVEGAEVWSPANVAPILEHPEELDLPCLWHDPIPVDRVLPLGEPVAWREYELTAHSQPGHTLYAAALEVEVDGRRVLVIGDQQGGGGDTVPDVLNYQYRNRFRIDDYVASAELYRRLRPDLLLGGHWPPREVTGEYLDRLLADGRELAELHRQLLPLDEVDFGAEGFGARIAPYRSRVAAGDELELRVHVRNPFDRIETAVVRLVLPDGWRSDPERREQSVPPLGEATLTFRVVAAGPPRRVPVAADLTVGDTPFGQQAEALVTVE
ncbi:MAG TPA: MBL fold metallo-hydrolase [Gaiellaceae bacterium]|nr:MBL fold metallo-hydrolase [Gaiellaceae bacterium]